MAGMNKLRCKDSKYMSLFKLICGVWVFWGTSENVVNLF